MSTYAKDAELALRYLLIALLLALLLAAAGCGTVCGTEGRVWRTTTQDHLLRPAGCHYYLWDLRAGMWVECERLGQWVCCDELPEICVAKK